MIYLDARRLTFVYPDINLLFVSIPRLLLLSNKAILRRGAAVARSREQMMWNDELTRPCASYCLHLRFDTRSYLLAIVTIRLFYSSAWKLVSYAVHDRALRASGRNSKENHRNSRDAKRRHNWKGREFPFHSRAT